MPDILIAIFNMSIAGSVVILLALIARLFLQRFSKKYPYILWGIVCLRLICPFGISFPALLNLFQGKEAGNIINLTEYIPQAIGGALFHPDSAAGNVSLVTYTLTVLFVIWFIGFAGMLLYEITAYNNARKRLATAIKIQDRVFETDQISTPFIFGLVNPKIYVPVGMGEKELEYVLCHEFTHIGRKDYLIKFFYCFVLAFHWFNPFVWLAFKYMSIDMEMSCDEKVVASLGDSIRKEYAEIILSLSQTKIKITKSMLTFGASDTRMRVNNVLNKKRNTVIGITVTVIVCAILVVGIVSNSAISSMFGFISGNAYEREVIHLTSTDLSGIIGDEMKIGSDIAEVDLSAYENSGRFSHGDYAHYLDRLVLDVDDNSKVSYVFGYNSEVSISINGESVSTIDEVTRLLGGNYLDRAEDREQRLRKHVYYDSAADVMAEFVYAEYDGAFVWIVLRKLG